MNESEKHYVEQKTLDVKKIHTLWFYLNGTLGKLIYSEKRISVVAWETGRLEDSFGCDGNVVDLDRGDGH